MTNEPKPSEKDIARWERIKQEMLDRADIVAEFADDEREALNDSPDLRAASVIMRSYSSAKLIRRFLSDMVLTPLVSVFFIYV